MNKILDVAKQFEKRSSEEVKAINASVKTVITWHEEDLKRQLNDAVTKTEQTMQETQRSLQEMIEKQKTIVWKTLWGIYQLPLFGMILTMILCSLIVWGGNQYKIHLVQEQVENIEQLTTLPTEVLSKIKISRCEDNNQQIYACVRAMPKEQITTRSGEILLPLADPYGNKIKVE